MSLRGGKGKASLVEGGESGDTKEVRGGSEEVRRGPGKKIL
jgi:hypothetical protein